MKITVLFIVLKELNEQNEEFDEGMFELLPVYQLEAFLKDSDRNWKIERYYFKEFNDDNVDELQERIDDLENSLSNISSHLDDAMSWLSDVEYEIDKARDEIDY